MSPSPQDQYHQLAYYTLAHKDKAFIHQNVVDAFTAQTANLDTKPIAIIFALAGLYLFAEKNYTGREVQLAHMQMAKSKRVWPAIILPIERGNITIGDVLATAEGGRRDEMIRDWCVAVWDAYKANRETIVNLIKMMLDV